MFTRLFISVVLMLAPTLASAGPYDLVSGQYHQLQWRLLGSVDMDARSLFIQLRLSF